MRPVARLSSSEEHVALADAIASVAAAAGTREQARTAYDDPADSLPKAWAALAAAELLAIAVDGDVLDAAVTVCELGKELAPGPVVPTMVAAILGTRHGSPDVCRLIDAGLRDGSFTAAISCDDLDDFTHTDLLLGGSAVSHVLMRTADGWALIDSGELALSSYAGIDPSRRLARASAKPESVARERILVGLPDRDVLDLFAVLLSAEACGLAAWCVDTAVGYALVREQFGQVIGGFQAVKHRCADLFASVEIALAAVWDAASALASEDRRSSSTQLASAVAAAVAPETAVEAAKGLIQILGGIGYTWEHDAHLYLKRSLATRQLFGGADAWRQRVAELASSGVRRHRSIDLSEHGNDIRREVREFLASIENLEPAARRRAMADAGYITPHWPAPYGRDAGPLDQLVIDEEFAEAGVARPDLVIGNWALPTIVGHGTDAQRERFVRPTLYGEIVWCQMFSEPNAGSDLASLTTKAVQVEGGWSLSGQKVWTSSARIADWAICLARTSSGADRSTDRVRPHSADRVRPHSADRVRPHDGITYFLVDMRTPGLDVRPLRELTGEALFNEIFLTDVFVPDDCVVGSVGDGWRLARTTLANERVAMSSGSAFPSGIEELLAAAAAGGRRDDTVALSRIGELVARAQADAMLGVRATLARASGTDPGAASSVRKLVGMHLRQDAADLALEMLGPNAAALDDEVVDRVLHRMLQTRALTIAGGTSEVLHNVIGERILGLPR